MKQHRSGSRREERRVSTPRVATYGLEAVLAGRVQRALPEAEVTVAGDPRGADLAVVDSGELARLDVGAETRVVEIRSSEEAGGRDHGIDPDLVLHRPILSGELAAAIRPLLDLPVAGSDEAERPSEQTRRWLDRSRLVAVVLGGMLELARGNVGVSDALLFGAVALYVGLRHGRRTTALTTWIDGAVVAALLLVTGGIGSSYLPLSLVTAAVSGFARGPGIGIALGALLSLAGLAGSPALVSGDTALVVVGWLFLHPLTGAVGGMLARLRGLDRLPGTRALEEANELLRGVHRLAREIPGGLDVRSVSGGILEEVVVATGAEAAVLFAVHDERALPVGAIGVPRPRRPLSVGDLLEGGGQDWMDHLGPPARGAIRASGPWHVAPLRRHGELIGVLVAAVGSRPERELVARLADEAAIALENARIFESLRDLATRSERLRLARELHDGAVQTLTHVLLQFELLDDEPNPAERVHRLRRVVEHTLDDVREAIDGLRSTGAAGGIVATLREHLEALAPLTPADLQFEAHGRIDVSPDERREIARIVQEAVWNALRHSEATTISVEMRARDGDLQIVVVDDGRGGARPAPGNRFHGYGLRAMQERANSIGADLRIHSADGDGTRIELALPRVREVSA